MSAAKTLTIEFEDIEAFKSRVTKALKTRSPSLRDKNVLIFRSVTGYFKFMTAQKLTIIAVLATRKPKSIYQLADFLDRDFANVQRDCVALSAHGFIQFDVAEDSRKSKAPRLAFDYNRMIIRMPKVTYSHNFGDAA